MGLEIRHFSKNCGENCLRNKNGLISRKMGLKDPFRIQTPFQNKRKFSD